MKRSNHWNWNFNDFELVDDINLNEAEDQYGHYEENLLNTKKLIRKSLYGTTKKEEIKHPPEGAHIHSFAVDKDMVSIHDGKGGNKILPKDEYIKKYLPHYHPNNPAGHVYHEYTMGKQTYVTSHDWHGNITTVAKELREHKKSNQNDMSHLKSHGTDLTDKRDIKLYPQGTYENPYKNTSVGGIKRHNDDGSVVTPADYYDRTKTVKKYRKTLLSTKDHHDNLTDNERYHIKKYKDESFGINRTLRGMDPWERENRKEKIGVQFKEKYDALDKVTSHHTVEDLHVYRGFDPYQSRKGLKKIFPQDMKPGFTFKDHGYTSTSLNASAPRSHSNGMHEDREEKIYGLPKTRKSIFKIHLPKGTKGHFIDHEDNPYQHEQEFLLHRGSTFKVTHHSVDNDTHFIHVKLVAQEHHSNTKGAPIGKNMIGPKNFSKFTPKKLTEGKTIKDRDDHWNWSDKQIERIKNDDKKVRMERKKKDRSHHWNWSHDDIEEVRDPDATLHEDLNPETGVPVKVPNGSISRPYKNTKFGS